MVEVLRHASKEELFNIENCESEPGIIEVLHNIDTSKGWVIYDPIRGLPEGDDIVYAVRVTKVLDFNKYGFRYPPVFVFFIEQKGDMNYNGWADKYDPVSKAIESWDLLNGLKGDAKEAWKDILS